MHDETFLHKSETTHVHTRHRRRRFYRSLVTVILVIVSAWVVLLALAVGQLVAAALDVRDAMGSANTHAQTQEFTFAKNDLVDATRSLHELERALFFLRTVWVFPGFDRQLEDLQGAFISSRQLLESLGAFFELGEDVMQLTGSSDTVLSDLKTSIPPHATFKDLPASTKRAILQRLSTASDDFDLLSARIEIAKIEFERLRTNLFVSPFLGVLDPFLDRMDDIHNELSVASTLAHVLPELAGVDGIRTHLLLFLNNDELRPGGGFIGTYGVLKTDGGEILSLETKDVYAIDSAAASEIKTIPPVPLQKYNATQTWFFRDGNWSPDFAVSAQKLIELFEQESSIVGFQTEIPTAAHVDGVIGFTPTAASVLLSYLGPVQAGGQTFTAENVPELIEYQVEKGFLENGIPLAQRKEILSELVVQIQDRLVTLPFSKWSDIFLMFSQAISNKQIAVYSQNESVQKALITSGWSGTISAGETDVQLFVDANLASLKTDPAVKRALRYELFRNESGAWVGRTTVTYDHQGTFDWRTTRYRTYARLFVPEGTTLVRATGFQEGVEIASDLGLTSFGGFVVVEPGTEHSIVFEYRLADEVVELIAKRSYQLSFYKQMGAQDYALTLDLDFDKNVTNAQPPENRNEWGDDRYRLNTKLSQDRKIGVSL